MMWHLVLARSRESCLAGVVIFILAPAKDYLPRTAFAIILGSANH